MHNLYAHVVLWLIQPALRLQGRRSDELFRLLQDRINASQSSCDSSLSTAARKHFTSRESVREEESRCS